MLGWILLFLLIVVIVLFTFIIDPSSINGKSKRAREEMRLKRQYEREAYIRDQIRVRSFRLGPMTREIGKNKFISPIQIYDESNVIFINNKELPYEKIIGYSVSDNSCTVTMGGNMTSKASTGSMISRGVVGGLALGGIGALAGASTAKRNITKSNEFSSIEHDFTIYVNVDNIKESLIRIDCGSRETLAREVESVLAYIINKNKTPASSELPGPAGSI